MEREMLERERQRLKLDLIDYENASIDWKIVEETMNLKSDILLMHYLKKLNRRVVVQHDDSEEKGYTLLHLAVLKGKPDLIHSLVIFARDV